MEALTPKTSTQTTSSKVRVADGESPKSAKKQTDIANMVKTLETMWPNGEWCPARYRPLIFSKSLLTSMQSLTRLWARERRPLLDLWNEDEPARPGLLVEAIQARTKGAGKLSAASAAEALRQARLLISQEANETDQALPTTIDLASDTDDDDEIEYDRPIASPTASTASDFFDYFPSDTLRHGRPTRKRCRRESRSPARKRARCDSYNLQHTPPSNTESTEPDPTWDMSRALISSRLRSEKELNAGALATCQKLLARSEHWMLFEPGFPFEWTSAAPGQPSRRRWPRHMVFIMHQRHHWTVGHLDKKHSTFDTYNSASHIPVSMDRVRDWITKEFDQAVLNRVKFSEKACPQQTDGVNCGIFALVVVACLFQHRTIPNAIDPRRYRDFFAHHLESGTKFGTLRLSKLQDAVDKPISHSPRAPPSTPDGRNRQQQSNNVVFTFSVTVDGKKPRILPARSVIAAYEKDKAREKTERPSRKQHPPTFQFDGGSRGRNPKTDDPDPGPRRPREKYTQKVRTWLDRMPSPDNSEHRLYKSIKSGSEALVDKFGRSSLG